MDDFSKQKLVWTPVNSEYRFTILPKDMYFNNSLFMIVGGNLEYFCGVLNSKLYRWYFSMILSSGAYAYGSREFFKNVPILKAEAFTKKDIEKVVRDLLDKYTKENADLIDMMIYELYGISDKEIDYIDKLIEV